MADIRVTQVGFVMGSSNKSKHLIDAENVKGGYIVVSTLDERNNLPVATSNDADHDGVIVNGSLVYVTATGKSYRYDTSTNPASWVQEVSAGAGLTDVAYDGTNKKFTKTTNDGLGNNNSSVTSDIVSLTTLKTDLNLHSIADSGSWNDLEDIPNDIVYKDDADGDYVRKGDSTTNYAEDIYGTKTFKSEVVVDSNADLKLNKLTASRFLKLDSSNKVTHADTTSVSTTSDNESISIDGTSLKLLTKNTNQTVTSTKTFTVSPVLNNGIYLRGKSSNGSDITLIGISDSDETRVGNSASDLVFYTSSSILPNAGDTKTIGKSDLKWKDLYLSDTAYTTNIGLPSAGGIIKVGTSNEISITSTDAKFDGNVIPWSNSAKNLGSNTLHWNNLYLSGDIYTGDNDGESTPTYYKLQVPTLTKDETIATISDIPTALGVMDVSYNSSTHVISKTGGSSADNIVDLDSFASVSLGTAGQSNETITIGGNSANILTRDRNQTISGDKTWTGKAKFNYGMIKPSSTEFLVKTADDTTTLFSSNGNGFFTKDVIPLDNNSGNHSLGSSTSLWKDLYLDGELKLKGSTDTYNISVDDTYNELRIKNGTTSYYTFNSYAILPAANKSLGSINYKWVDLYMTGVINKNAASDGKGLLLPDTTGWTANKIIATTDQIPAVYNATLTITQNSTSVGTFTANASSAKTIDIVTPKVYRYI